MSVVLRQLKFHMLFERANQEVNPKGSIDLQSGAINLAISFTLPVSIMSTDIGRDDSLEFFVCSFLFLSCFDSATCVANLGLGNRLAFGFLDQHCFCR